jgi:thiol-disulfide isomerase/thioredoxin
MRFVVVLVILLFSLSLFGQSGRVAPQDPGAPGASAADDRPVKALFDEANRYRNLKFTEFEEKKLPVSEKLIQQTQLEQKQLAAKYAAMVATRTNLAGDDYYYHGLLHWIAENYDGAAEALGKYLAVDLKDPERAQASRTLITMIAAKQKRFDNAEKTLLEYIKTGPSKKSELARMEGEIAKAYQSAKDHPRAAFHAREFYDACKAMVVDAPSRAKALDELLDAGMLVFETNRDSGNQKEADAALDDMRKIAAELGSPSFFYYAADKKITYMIETGRKQQALETYLTSLIAASKELPLDQQRQDAISRLKKREKHYNLLGAEAPELVNIAAWLPGEKKTIAGLKGKVVLLDFWATWCGPCFKAFPSLIEWQQEYKKDGLEILGISRFEGRVNGAPADTKAELEYLKGFKIKEGLTYDLLVGSDPTNQYNYYATGLPTTVLIDRKGVVRYIEVGTSPTRLEELHEVILKLLAEK